MLPLLTFVQLCSVWNIPYQILQSNTSRIIQKSWFSTAKLGISSRKVSRVRHWMNCEWSKVHNEIDKRQLFRMTTIRVEDCRQGELMKSGTRESFEYMKLASIDLIGRLLVRWCWPFSVAAITAKWGMKREVRCVDVSRLGQRHLRTSETLFPTVGGRSCSDMVRHGPTSQNRFECDSRLSDRTCLFRQRLSLDLSHHSTTCHAIHKDNHWTSFQPLRKEALPSEECSHARCSSLIESFAHHDWTAWLIVLRGSHSENDAWKRALRPLVLPDAIHGSCLWSTTIARLSEVTLMSIYDRNRIGPDSETVNAERDWSLRQ
jgi:hypothetical protein